MEKPAAIIVMLLCVFLSGCYQSAIGALCECPACSEKILCPNFTGAVVLFACLAVVLALLTVALHKNRKTARLALESEIKSKELIADNAALDRLNRMKAEFFQNMSHELKAPLTVISTNILDSTDMLDFEIDKDEMRKSLENAQREIMRMSKIVDNAIKYSIQQDNKQAMSILDIAPLLRDGALSHAALLKRHGNALVIKIPQSLPEIFCNPDMLLHVLSNLISNANRHTHNGKITICAAKENGIITVKLKDTGSGVDPGLMPNIFERGVTSSGTGLGLHICKSTIEAHGGTISIESDYGHSTEVTFALPVYQGGAPQ